MELINRVGRFIQDNSLLKDGDRVVVGVSGGADSVALLLLLRGLGFECTAVHCNFHLRGAESDRDQEFVQSLCSRMDIPLRVCHYDTKGYAAVHKCSGSPYEHAGSEESPHQRAAKPWLVSQAAYAQHITLFH